MDGRHNTRDAGILKPHGPESGFVHFAIQGKKGPARRHSVAGAPVFGSVPDFARQLLRLASREGAGQTPSNKQKGFLGDIGMPVGKPSAVKHSELAGESACPTYSGATSEQSRKNGKTPRARQVAARPTGPTLASA